MLADSLGRLIYYPDNIKSEKLINGEWIGEKEKVFYDSDSDDVPIRFIDTEKDGNVIVTTGSRHDNKGKDPTLVAVDYLLEQGNAILIYTEKGR